MDQFEKDFTRLNSNLKKIANALNDRKVTIRLARKCKEIVYRRVKSGYGVTSDSDAVGNTERQKLKELSKSYIAWRKGLVVFYTDKRGNTIALGAYTTRKTAHNENGRVSIRTTKKYNEKLKITPPQLGEFGRPEKSNATLSGQMLNALVMDAGEDGFRLFIADTPRKKVHPKMKPSRLTNKEVAEYYSKKRPFMALTEGEVRILKQECETIIAEKIKELIR